MNKNQIRIAAATAMAGIAFGIAAPAANATEVNCTAGSVSAVELAALKAANPASAANGESEITPEQLTEMTALAKAAEAERGDQHRGERAAGKFGNIINLLKKSPDLMKAAVKAAKKGARAFENWVSSLSNWNPVKWAIKAAPEYLILQLIDYLRNM
ncbi:hypothetical protein V2E29_01520 [Streptomyces diastatochromogenes]|uniref:hypothetical protein n=1 Tax=Streptomyces diastatochromogenes TaxID=42236 RepID=UPI002F265B0B